MDFDTHFMAMALREAEKAAADGEVPAGCVVVEPAWNADGTAYDPDPSTARILGRAHNQTEGLVDATAHAEMLALSAAFAAKGAWRLVGTRLYVTKEPCPMCAGAIVLARVGTVVWGVDDPKRGGGNQPPSCHRARRHGGCVQGCPAGVLQKAKGGKGWERERRTGIMARQAYEESAL